MLRLAAVAVAAAALAATASGSPRTPLPSEARGLPWSGSLVRGVQLPAAGAAYVTWDPVRKRSPNRAWRRWGTDRLARTLLRVLGRYADAYPRAPRVVVGDLSRPHGGDFGARFGWPGHASHQNGLDVDVYYPRHDRRLRPPARPGQIDRRLAQDLVDRFVRAGATHVFVGPHTGLRGPRRVVSVLPAFHDNHMHVRLANRPCTRPVVNAIHGFRVAVPCGWSARVGGDGSTTISAPGMQLRLSAYGRVPGARPQPGNRHVRLGPPVSFEGVGGARTTSFALRGRVFEAVVHPAPPAHSRTLRRVTALLRSVRLTRRAFEIANEHRRLTIGRSVEGRPLRAWRIGNPRARHRVLVVGCVHGNECAGTAVTARLVDNGLPLAGELVVVQYLNPDGFARRARWNARGVDLNRNFPFGWSPTARHGRRPFSEPEVEALRQLVRRFRPDITVWFHQPQGLVRAWGSSVPVARRYAHATGLPFRQLRWIGGSAPQWQNRALGEVSFVVELAPGDLSGAAANRHARALLGLVR